jgi:hypothetical protein
MDTGMGMGTDGAITAVAATTTVGTAAITMVGTGATTMVGGIIAIGKGEAALVGGRFYSANRFMSPLAALSSAHAVPASSASTLGAARMIRPMDMSRQMTSKSSAWRRASSFAPIAIVSSTSG